jgi:hypothetical protein
LSVIYNTPSGVGVQGIVGAFAGLKEYGGRILYRIETTDGPRPYLFGLAGLWSYTGYGYGDGSASKTETVPGAGVGAGVEYFFAGMPSLGFNLEVGYSAVSFKEVNYNFNAVMLGAGEHYYIR